MTYATQQDFIDAFGEREIISLTNLFDPSATTINSAKLTQCQQDAKALIDALISTSNLVAAQMPFTVIPPLLRTFELDICRYKMDSNLAREGVRARYEDAIAQLRLIGAGKMSLGLSGDTPPVELPNPTLTASSYETTQYFDNGVLSGY